MIHQRHLTPSCGGHAPTAERTLNPARMSRHGELDPTPGIREQPRPKPDVATIIQIVSTCTIPKQSRPLRVSRLFTVWVSTDEIQGLALFLASPASTYVTGSQIVIDGSVLLGQAD